MPEEFVISFNSQQHTFTGLDFNYIGQEIQGFELDTVLDDITTITITASHPDSTLL